MKQHILYFLTTIFLFFSPMWGLMIAVGMALDDVHPATSGLQQMADGMTASILRILQ